MVGDHQITPLFTNSRNKSYIQVQAIVALLYHRGNLLPLVSSMVLVGKTKGLGLVEGFESPPNSVQVDNSPSNFPRMAESLREDSLSVVRLGVDLIRPSSSGNVA